ncbi:MAG: ABC transporter ATP-binding protein [Candidatus Omnitrophica bacterium]|nr:ABC transporter ATP-binding protein [Candidatus Omnitrophota bacterium]
MDKPGKTQFKLFFRFLKVLLPYRKRWLAILILSGSGTLLGLINPYLTKLVIDKGIINKDLKAFVILVLIGAGIFILNGAVEGLKQFLGKYIRHKVNFGLNKQVFKHLEGLSLNYFQDKSTGEHLYKIGYDLERVTDFISTTPPQAITLFPKLLLTLGIVFYLNWRITLLSLVLAPFLYLPTYYFTRRMRKVWQALIEHSQDIFKSLQETFSHVQLVKVFGKEAASVNDYLKRLIVNIRLRIKNIRLEIFSGFASNAATRIILGVITFYGGYQVIKGEMTLGTLTAIMVYLRQLVGLQGNFAHFFQTVALGLISCQRVACVLDEKTKVVQARYAKELRLQKGQIVFQDVSFAYRAGEPVFEKLKFTIEGESHIALVGPSGCGKTTLLNLILRLYEPSSGDILIDGQRIKELSFSSLKGQIGMALQEPFLLNDTVRRNIAYAVDGVDDKEIIEAARICGVDEFVRHLSKGYQTIIGENACKLSEGQKQKIAIARALVKKPKILILDEAFSSMDSASEEGIIRNIKENFKHITLIVVSHRLSTVLNADLVYFLNRPDRLIIGKAEELLRKDEEFSVLFAGQRKID